MWTSLLFSFLRQLTTWHCSQLLLSAGRATIDRYLLAAGPTVANPPHAWSIDGTDRGTPYRYVDPVAYYASSVSDTEYYRRNNVRFRTIFSCITRPLTMINSNAEDFFLLNFGGIMYFVMYCRCHITRMCVCITGWVLNHTKIHYRDNDLFGVENHFSV